MVLLKICVVGSGVFDNHPYLCKGLNPILKIHFPKEMWVVIDFFSGIFLILIREKIQENDKQSTIIAIRQWKDANK
jgi:hypothetical protein